MTHSLRVQFQLPVPSIAADYPAQIASTKCVYCCVKIKAGIEYCTPGSGANEKPPSPLPWSTATCYRQELSSTDNLASRALSKLSLAYLHFLMLYISFCDLSIIIIRTKINPVTEEMRGQAIQQITISNPLSTMKYSAMVSPIPDTSDQKTTIRFWCLKMRMSGL